LRARGLAGFPAEALVARAAGRRVFFSLAAELAREEDGESSSDLGGKAMSWDSERRMAPRSTSDAEASPKFQAAERASAKRSI